MELLDLLQQRQLTHLKERLEQKDSLQDSLMRVQEDITDPYNRSVSLRGTPHGNH
jgi:hypothetical protein